MSAVRYPRADDITVSEIAHLLAWRAVEVAAELLPNGHRERHEWRCGSVGGEDGNSLGVHLTGARPASGAILPSGLVAICST